MQDRYFLMAILCMVTWTGGFLYVSTILNPMLLEYYKMETEKSSLFYTLAGVAFLISTPIAFQLRSRKLMARRAILVMGMWLMGFSMIIRTGNLK